MEDAFDIIPFEVCASLENHHFLSRHLVGHQGGLEETGFRFIR